MLKETPIHKWAIAFLQKVMKNKRCVKLLAKEITISQIYMIYISYIYIYIYITKCSCRTLLRNTSTVYI